MTASLLERPQEVDNFLLLLSLQPVEAPDDQIGLAAWASVRPDGFHQVGRTSSIEPPNGSPVLHPSNGFVKGGDRKSVV